MDCTLNSVNQSQGELYGIIQRCLKNISIENSNDFNHMLDCRGNINEQGDFPVCNMKYGYKETMDNNGCELIGIYNALVLKGKTPMLSEIAMEFELSNGMGFGLDVLKTHPSCNFLNIIQSSIGISFKSGRFGSNPFFIDYYLNAHKQMHFKTNSLSELESWKKPGRVFILSCWNSKSEISYGLHTFAVITQPDGTLESYNGYDYNQYSQFSDLISSQRSLICAYYII